MERKPFVKISLAEDGAVLIAYLTARFTYLSADAWRNMLLEGRVSVNGLSARADRKLCAGEVVAFDPPRLEEPEVDPTFAVVGLRKIDALVAGNDAVLASDLPTLKHAIDTYFGVAPSIAGVYDFRQTVG